MLLQLEATELNSPAEAVTRLMDENGVEWVLFKKLSERGYEGFRARVEGGIVQAIRQVDGKLVISGRFHILQYLRALT
jgi:hypothetical protein